jgi:hypothetical protein
MKMRETRPDPETIWNDHIRQLGEAQLDPDGTKKAAK